MFAGARFRLTLSYVLALGAILCIAAFATYFTLARSFRAESDSALRTRAREELARLRPSDFSGNGSSLGDDEDDHDRSYEPVTADILVYILDAQGHLVSGPPAPRPDGLPAATELAEAATENSTIIRAFSAEEHEFRLLSTPVFKDGRLLGYMQLAKSEEQHQQELSALRSVLLFTAVGGLILTGFGGFILTGRTLAPIRSALQRQREFAADASHELRTPLAVIRANIEVALRGDAPDRDVLLQDSISEVDHMSRLVDDLLTIARIDSGTITVLDEPVDLGAVSGEAVRGMEKIASSTGRSLRFQAGDAVIVRGDPSRLRQLTTILVDNALRYNQKGGSVDVAVSRERDRAVLTVRDSGIGIPKEALPRVFERFYRADHTRSARVTGTGLGLPIARWIVEAHHGRLRIDSTVGQGTTIEIAFPSAPAAPAPAGVAPTVR